MRNRQFPNYPDDTDYNTNSPSYLDDLARKQKLIELLSKRIWEYDKELAERFEAWDKNLEDFPEDVKVLLQQWVDNGTLDHIINDTIFNWKLDTTIFEEFRDGTTEKLQQKEVSVLDFGAVADGVTDDSTAFQLALDHISQNDGNAKRLFIPVGTYLIDNELFVDGNDIEVFGNGPRSKLIAGPNLTRAMFYSSRSDRNRVLTLLNVVFRNFMMDGQGTANTNGLLFHGFNRGCLIDKMYIYGFGHAQVNLIGSWCWTLSNCIIRGSWTTNPDNTRHYYGYGLACGDRALAPEDTEIGQVNAVNVINNSFQFLNIGVHHFYGSGGRYDGNTFENCRTRWFEFFYPQGLSIKGNYFESCLGQYGGYLGGTSTAEKPLSSVVFEDNIFMPRQEGQAGDVLIRQVQRTSIQNNHHGDSHGYDYIASSTIDPTISYGNTIEYRKAYVATSFENAFDKSTNRLKASSNDLSLSTTNTIVESGTNPNGQYIRFSDGTQICYRTVEVDLTEYNTPQTFSFPVEFITSSPHKDIYRTIELIGSINDYNNFKKTGGVYFSQTNNWGIRVVYAGSGSGHTTDNTKVSFMVSAVGKWK